MMNIMLKVSDFLTHAACPVCKGDIEIIFKGIKVQPYLVIPPSLVFGVYKCINCDLNFLNPSPKPEIISRLYPTEYYRPVDVVKSSPSDVQKAYLEIGCGDGSFFKETYESSKYSDYWLVDLNDPLLKKLQPLPSVKTILAALDDVKLPPNYFDYIELSHVFEHVLQPHKVLDKLILSLKRGGMLHITVPRFDGLSTNFLGNKAYYSCPQHLYFYTPDNIAKLIKLSRTPCDHGIEYKFGNVLTRDLSLLWPILKLRPVYLLLTFVVFILESFTSKKENMVISIVKK